MFWTLKETGLAKHSEDLIIAYYGVPISSTYGLTVILYFTKLVTLGPC